MALTPSGTISLANINTALGRGATATISMNDGDVRFLANQPTSISMNNMRNKYYFSGTVYSKVGSGKAGTYYGYAVYDLPGSYMTGEFNGFNPGADNFLSEGGTYMNVFGGSYPNIGSLRLQVGSGPIAVMAEAFGGYSDPGVNCFGPSDVDVLRTWRMATP